METMAWRHMIGWLSTPEGEPIWVCPVCNKGLHACSADNRIKDKCPNCDTALIYPIDKRERNK